MMYEWLMSPSSGTADEAEAQAVPPSRSARRVFVWLGERLPIQARRESQATQWQQLVASTPVEQGQVIPITASPPAFIARQGDVLIMSHSGPVRGSPVLPEAGRIVLATGGVTGHQHSFHDDGRIALFRNNGFTRAYLRIEGEPARLEHPEHAAIAVPPGSYEVRLQREYSLEAILPVRE